MVPARAGVVLHRAGDRAGVGNGPRTCGGGPPALGIRIRVAQWSPHVRGWSAPDRAAHVAVELTEFQAEIAQVRAEVEGRKRGPWHLASPCAGERSGRVLRVTWCR